MSSVCGRSKVPVTIVTGFLGSGKTTLVNRILRHVGGAQRVAVIENEFGEVGVDDALVIETQEELFEMNNGCVCCTVRGDLVRILRKLAARPRRLDAVLIETTGLADPAPVAQTFFVDDEVKAAFALDAIVTVVDAAHAAAHLDEVKPEGVENESVEQVAFADVILLNKVDLVDAAAADALEARLRALNASAALLRCRGCDVAPAAVLGVGAFDLARVLDMDAGFLDTGAEHQHDATVGSVGIAAQGEVDGRAVDAWLGGLLRERGVDIFRSKGVLAVRGRAERVVFHGVHMMLAWASSAEGAARPWRDGEARGCRLVFIGRNLDRAALEAGFRACLVAP